MGQPYQVADGGYGVVQPVSPEGPMPDPNNVMGPNSAASQLGQGAAQLDRSTQQGMDDLASDKYASEYQAAQEQANKDNAQHGIFSKNEADLHCQACDAKVLGHDEDHGGGTGEQKIEAGADLNAGLGKAGFSGSLTASGSYTVGHLKEGKFWTKEYGTVYYRNYAYVKVVKANVKAEAKAKASAEKGKVSGDVGVSAGPEGHAGGDTPIAPPTGAPPNIGNMIQK